MVKSPFTPSPGRFLVSEPFMGDPNFRRTVVLLVEHSSEGSLGFVMNRQLNSTLDEIVEGLPAFEAPVFMGGPVEQNTLHYVHKLGDRLPGSQKVIDGLYWGGDYDALKDMIRMGTLEEEEILFFVGYSGWAPGQLDEELARKAWIIAPENPEFVFLDDYEDLWRKVLQQMGKRYQVISNYPTDPRLN